MKYWRPVRFKDTLTSLLLQQEKSAIIKAADLFILQQYPETSISLCKCTSCAGHMWRCPLRTPQIFKHWSTIVAKLALYVIILPVWPQIDPHPHTFEALNNLIYSKEPCVCFTEMYTQQVNVCKVAFQQYTFEICSCRVAYSHMQSFLCTHTQAELVTLIILLCWKTENTSVRSICLRCWAV